MAKRRVTAVSGVLFLAFAGVFALRHFTAVNPDPFGTPEQVWASLTPAQRSIQEAGTREFSQRSRDRLARVIAVKGRFQGEPRELAPYLADLDQAVLAPATTEEGLAEDRDACLMAIVTITRAWYAHGPYYDGKGIENRVLKHAIARSESSVLQDAATGASLVVVLDTKWPPQSPKPPELARQVALIRENPVLNQAAAATMETLRTGEAKLITDEQREFLKTFRPLGAAEPTNAGPR